MDWSSYKVLSKVGNVNYWIQTESRKKPKKLIHINLMKKYHERDKLINTHSGKTLLTLHEPVQECENSDIKSISELHRKEENKTFDLSNVQEENRPKLRRHLNIMTNILWHSLYVIIFFNKY